MSNNNQVLYIISALAASQKAMYYAKKFNKPNEFFNADEQVHFNATLTLLMAIGEEVKKIDKQLLQTQSNIQWQDLKDMRNFLAHDYRGVDLEIVFKVVKVELPKLSDAFIAFLRLFPKTEIEEALENEYYKHLYKIIF
ncbi:DUF86 domain-containing protein [Parasediminibacterium sp. JCM 36343]|uniref:HepT-like ribonuclease domain-containing protein n=1 Tax=Parasediminibacterium sp. JCM 36343 TaxID=3374279 RepID=UPI00397C19F4